MAWFMVEKEKAAAEPSLKKLSGPTRKPVTLIYQKKEFYKDRYTGVSPLLNLVESIPPISTEL